MKWLKTYFSHFYKEAYLLLQIVSVRKEGKEGKTVIVALNAISYIDFEYDTEKETGKESGKICIHFTANNADLDIGEKEDGSLLFRIFDCNPTCEFYEADSIKGFETDYLNAMQEYIAEKKNQYP